MRKVFVLFLMAVMALVAADVSGAWKGTLETPMGAMELTANLKVDGGAVTGTINFMDNPLKIENGKLDGDKISFTVNPEFGTMTYKGTVSGDEMKLTLTVMDNDVPLTLKRAK